MHINGVTIPTTLDNRGTYIFEPPAVVRKNGKGLAVTGGYSKLTWRWARMKQSDWNWWCTTILTGLASKQFSSAQLYNHMNVLTTFSNVVVNRPTFEKVSGARYINVQIEITNIL